ncbi:MAG: hypothetical protein GY741_01885, partial [Phycisphaeraceae bacterium]|nr:hypothetical protein [Phycisphaeraceae bacterium]
MFTLVATLTSILLLAGTGEGGDPVRVESRDRGTARSSSPATIDRTGAHEYRVNLGEFAEGVVRSKANLTLVGDSINEFGQWNWMYTGYLLQWNPHRWRQ